MIKSLISKRLPRTACIQQKVKHFLFQKCKVLDLKELAAIEVILQFKRLVKPRYNGWYIKFKCDETCQFSENLTDIHVSYFEGCSACTWSQWIKECKLPKEVENYCETVLNKWDYYSQDSDLEDYPDDTDSENEYTSEDESSDNGSDQEEIADGEQEEQEDQSQKV